jgi:AraC-like DNA-binding protein
MVQLLRGEQFFEPDFPMFLNRETESFRVKFHQHDFIELCLVEEGSGYQHIEDETIPVRKGDLFLLPIGTSHVFRPASPQTSEPLIICNCIFKAEVLQEILDWLPPNPLFSRLADQEPTERHWYQFQDKHHRFQELFRAAYIEYQQRSSNYHSMLRAYLVQILILLDRVMRASDASGQVQDTFILQQEKIGDILSHMNLHMHEPLTLQKMADTFYMSTSHFQRIFKTVTGQPFNKYLQHMRIQRSCHLLIHTTLTVQQIAAQVGYADMKFFHTLFRRITGCTPQQYRQLNR